MTTLTSGPCIPGPVLQFERSATNAVIGSLGFALEISPTDEHVPTIPPYRYVAYRKHASTLRMPSENGTRGSYPRMRRAFSILKKTAPVCSCQDSRSGTCVAGACPFDVDTDVT